MIKTPFREYHRILRNILQGAVYNANNKISNFMIDKAHSVSLMMIEMLKSIRKEIKLQ